MVVAKRKDGSPRVCVDYRKMNRKIERDRFPLPLFDDVLNQLQSAHVFSVIDLKNGFHHVPVEKESRKYTAFVT